MQSSPIKNFWTVNKKDERFNIFKKFNLKLLRKERHALFTYLSGFHQVSYSFFVVFPILAIVF